MLLLLSQFNRRWEGDLAQIIAVVDNIIDIIDEVGTKAGVIKRSRNRNAIQYTFMN